MRRLMLLRHAKTEHDAPSGQDHDRRLDDRGRRDAAIVGDWIGRHLAVPELILVSTAVRAQQTWEIVRQAIQDAAKGAVPRPQVESLDELYGAEPAQLLKVIRIAEGADVRQLMVVGHNPGLHELALTLAGSGDAAARKALQDNLPTTGLAVLDFAVDGWDEVAFRRGTLVRFVSPKLLKQAPGN